MEPKIILKRNQKYEDGVLTDDFYSVFYYVKEGLSEVSFTISSDKLVEFVELLNKEINKEK